MRGFKARLARIEQAFRHVKTPLVVVIDPDSPDYDRLFCEAEERGARVVLPPIVAATCQTS